MQQTHIVFTFLCGENWEPETTRWKPCCVVSCDTRPDMGYWQQQLVRQVYCRVLRKTRQKEKLQTIANTSIGSRRESKLLGVIMPLNRISCLGGKLQDIKVYWRLLFSGSHNKDTRDPKPPQIFVLKETCCKSCVLKVHVAVVVWPMPLVPPHPFREGTGWAVLSRKYFTAWSG